MTTTGGNNEMARPHAGYPSLVAMASFFARSKGLQSKRAVANSFARAPGLRGGVAADFPFVLAESTSTLNTGCDRRAPLLLGKIQNLRMRAVEFIIAFSFQEKSSVSGDKLARRGVCEVSRSAGKSAKAA